MNAFTDTVFVPTLLLNPIRFWFRCHMPAALLVFDITDVDSFSRVKKWVRELKKMAGEFRSLTCLVEFSVARSPIR